eukprot:7387278-Prymnesium_polylepis.1
MARDRHACRDASDPADRLADRPDRVAAHNVCSRLLLRRPEHSPRLPPAVPDAVHGHLGHLLGAASPVQ